MKITVTQRYIDKGKRAFPDKCPVALALRHVFPGSDVSVGTIHAHIDDKSYRLPRTAYTFIFDFDLERPVKPFSFVLPKPKG